MFEMDYHVLQLRRDGATQEWECPECGRHLRVAWRPDFNLTVLVAGDEQVGHVSAHPSISLSGSAMMDADLVSGAADQGSGAIGSAYTWGGPAIDSFVTFGEPELSDGLTPWIRLIERLDRSGMR